jgi:zinc transport system substrate-binding protein
MSPMKLRVAPLLGTVAALAAATGLLTGCGSDESGGSGGGDGRLSLVASFYPLQFATQRVAGDRADVTSLTS